MIEKTVIGIFIAALIAIALYFVLRQRRVNHPIVLGQQFANAMAKEQHRLDKGDPANSPIPKGTYGRHKGEWDLLNPKHVEFDRLLRELCSSFAAKSSNERSDFRAAVSLEEFYTLIEFARRAAVFSLRSSDSNILQDGLTALAMIEAERTDFRDILGALALLHHSAARIGMNPFSAFQAAAKLAEPSTSELISGFAERDPQRQSLRDSWGYAEVETKSGIGFARWGFETYDPRNDLLDVAMRIASVIEQDSYFVDNIELATDLSSFWLEAPENAGIESVLAKVSGGATVTGRLDDSKHPDAGNQQFTVFTVELDSPDSAQALLRMSKAKTPKDYSMLGFAHDRLFSLVVARSVMIGVGSFEGGESLKRFVESIDHAIQQAVP